MTRRSRTTRFVFGLVVPCALALPPAVPTGAPASVVASAPSLATWCAQMGLQPVAMAGMCTHGPDTQAGLGMVAHVAAKGGKGGTQRAETVKLRCSSAEGNRIQVLYAHLQGKNRLGKVLSQVDRALGEANAIFLRSAQQTGGRRELAILTRNAGKDCKAAVRAVVVSKKALNDFNALMVEMRRQGFARSDRKYLVFGDGTTSVCGMGTVHIDDRAGPMNASNLGGSFALVGSGGGCWQGAVVAHELVHTLGGIQASAPHASGGHHCNDGHEIMCYDDGTAGSRQRRVCGTAHRRLLDCRNDDYFSTNPKPGSYLATHWNAAQSSFLHGGGPAAPSLPGPPRDLAVEAEAGGASDALRISWSAGTGRVTGYRLRLPDGRVLSLPASARSYTDHGPDRARDCTYTLWALNEAGGGSQVTVTEPGRGPVFLLR